ncbi:hypothetical protein DERP_010439 [Dermatophagoides pteronyssinus]|uniref:Uncharacterized protein n=1 Tax=Dermatophagoides pteronyssinus TaxID=6956 RepID=A0ABQ8J557_DERPT|nr:hypothetical protein DERP_010439 [Dermatophagoides pteronyssinus]
MKMSMTATNNNNNNNNDNINGEQQDLTSYLKSMFIELNGNINDVHSNLQPQPQQTSNSAIDKIIVNGDGSVISNSDVKHRDDCSRQQQQCETKKSELTKPFVITNVGVQQIIDDNNNNVVAVTDDDDDDSRNKIETKNTKDTLNKINGSCASTVQTNNSSTSSLSSSSMMMNEEKNNQSIILNSNDQKQDIVSKQQPKEPFNDQNQKQNQNDSLTDNNNNNLGNNDDHHRKKQEPNKIKHTNDHGDDENDDVQTNTRCSSVSQVEISSINSVETNNSNNGVNQRSNDPDNQIYSRSTSMVEVFDSDTIPVNKQKISNFRFESLKQERPVTRTRVKELREFWNNRSLIDKATQNNK